MLQTIIKIGLSLLIILLATGVAKKYPPLAGLIGVMPLTGALVFCWIHWENQGDTDLMIQTASAAIWGIIPSILFFVCLLGVLKAGYSFYSAFTLSAAVWILGAVGHQYFLRG
ncbi:DUF3147 family protein [Dethiosulfatarculus sandiegensis]|uniref:DUF3147 family protein n=1 Tax=Dethiosulfatarculus sandiegensis TaxID=1429043 RepID=UPI000697B55A|nr:DUF3147 family protein [Dethiosulfatarculus sandiegensis]